MPKILARNTCHLCGEVFAVTPEMAAATQAADDRGYGPRGGRSWTLREAAQEVDVCEDCLDSASND